MLGAHIKLINKKQIYETTSNFKGEFTFMHIKAGTYILMANYLGFRKLQSDSLFISPSSKTHIEIRMGVRGKDDKRQ